MPSGRLYGGTAPPAPLDTRGAAPFPFGSDDDRGSGSFFFREPPGKRPALADPEDPHKRARNTGQPPAGYVCKVCRHPGHYVQDCPDRTRTRAPPPLAPGKRGAAPGMPASGWVCRRVLVLPGQRRV